MAGKSVERQERDGEWNVCVCCGQRRAWREHLGPAEPPELASSRLTRFLPLRPATVFLLSTALRADLAIQSCAWHMLKSGHVAAPDSCMRCSAACCGDDSCAMEPIKQLWGGDAMILFRSSELGTMFCYENQTLVDESWPARKSSYPGPLSMPVLVPKHPP